MRPTLLLVSLTTIALAVTSIAAPVPPLPVEPPEVSLPALPAPGDPLPVVPGLNADYLDGRDSASFADRFHDHDERYYTQQQSDARFAAIGHDHDARYLGIQAKAADSDRLDGLDSSRFLRTDTSGKVEGTVVVERLGIGRDSPEATLHMRGGGPVLRMDNADDGGSWWLRHNSGSHQFVIGNTANLADSNIKLRIDANGDLAVTGHIFAHGGSHVGDIAEPVAGHALEPGDVVVLDGFDPSGKLRARKADAALSPAVIGVVSTDPSLRLAGLAQDTPLAVAGIVPVKVAGPVAAGDLLTTSAVLGHAMACKAANACFGAVLGKALEAHAGGAGVVRVLVALG